jgi:hypothetical protein
MGEDNHDFYYWQIPEDFTDSPKLELVYDEDEETGPSTKPKIFIWPDPKTRTVDQSQIYVGTLFPNGVDETMVLKGNKNHAIGIVRPYQGQAYTYYFGAAWSRYDVRTLDQWQLLAKQYLQNIKNPLIIEIK